MAIGVQVTFDAAEPERLARFWATALGYVEQPAPAGFASWEDFLLDAGVPAENWGDAFALVDPDGTGPRLYFQRVPEPKSAKNRVHLDVNVAAGVQDSDERRRLVDRLVTHGATKLREVEEHGGRHVVLRDPEDNEFCVQ